MLDVKALLQTHGEMKEDRRRDEPAWRDITRICRPDEQEFDSNARVDRDDYDVFDSTPMFALNQFSAGMFSENVNPAERYMELTTGDDDLDKWGPAQKWLWGEASMLLNSMAPSVANFYTEIPSAFANCGALGNGFMYQEEWPGRQTIIDQSIPVGQSYVKLDIAGNLDGFNREFKATGAQMKARWGESNCPNCEEGRSYTIVHAVYRNVDVKPGMLGPRGMMFASTYFSEECRGFRVDKGYYELPYHPFFWSKRNGRAWASGPGHIARADMNLNNEMARALMIDAQFAAEPMVLTHKEGMFTAADINPNAILEGALDSQGRELLKTVQRGDNPARAEHKHEQIKAAIKEAFMFNMLQVQDRPQMTATEFLGWKQERLRQLAPNLVSIQQGLASLIARRYRLLARAGQTTPMPPELNGRNIAVKFKSPLAKAQELATAQATMQWIGMLGQIAEYSQDPTVLDIVNKDGAARVLHKATAGTPEVINDQRTVQALRDARAQQQAAQQQTEQAAQQAGIVADVAHAAQAMSSAKGRSGRPQP